MTQALRDVHARLQAARGLFEAASEGATARVRAALAAGVHPDGYEADDGQTALLAALLVAAFGGGMGFLFLGEVVRLAART